MQMRTVVVLSVTLAACGGDSVPEWAGTIDTLPSGQVVVTNPATGVWGDTLPWQVVEEVRIGAEDGTGPEVLGRIQMLAEDRGGRIWAFESADQQFKVFGPGGEFIRTVGRRGGGPGEMQQASGVGVLPDGRILVVDMQGGRISLFDTTGTFLKGHPLSSGFQIFPWPGLVDRAGYLYHVVPITGGRLFQTAMVRYDSMMTPLDTLRPPEFESQDFFELQRGGGFTRAGIPHSASLSWRLTADGDFWSVMTGSYEMARVTGSGDTLRTVTKPFVPVAVTAEEKDSAVARLKWFTDQGGRVDRGRIPDTKPAVQSFFVADDGHLWVNATRADTAQANRVFEIFDPEGRYLGRLHLPFALLTSPLPLIGADRIVAVTQDELGVPYLVRARIVKPTADP